MAVAGSGLNFKAKVDTAEAQKSIENLKKMLKDLRIETSEKLYGGKSATAFDLKPISANQQANLALKKSLIDVQVGNQRLKAENLELSNSYKRGQIAAQEFTAEQKRLRQEQRELLESQKAARLAFKAASGSYDEASNRLKELGRSIRAAEGGFNSTNPAIRTQIQEYNKLNVSLRDFDAQMGHHQRNVGNYGGAVKGLINDLKSMALAYISIQGAISLATKAFDVALESDAIKTSLEFTLKSTDAVNAKMKDLRDTANRLGIDLLPLSKTYASFAGAAAAANFPLKETDKIFNSITGAAARFHLTSDQLSGSLLAIQQMISKGTVQSEELRGQLGERLPGAFSIAARAMGVTEQELGKMLKNGDVLASDLLPKLSDELDKTFSLDKNTRIESLTASTNRLKTSFDNLVQGEKATSFFQYIIDKLTNITLYINGLTTSKGWMEFFERLTTFGDARKILDVKYSIQDNFEQSSKVRSSENINPTGADSKFVVSALADKTLEELDQLHAKYLKATKQASEAVNSYRKGIAGSTFWTPFKDGGKYSLAEVERNFNQLQKNLNLVNEAYVIVEKKTKKATTGAKELTDAQLTSVEAIRKRIIELQKKDGSAIEGSDIYTRIDALKERLKNNDTEQKAALERAVEFSDKINKFHADSIKSQKSADQQELDSVTLKYAEMRKEADKFYSDPQNKGAVVRDQITGRPISKSQVYGRLIADEAAERNDVIYSQNAKKQLTALDIQKQQYIDFEKFVDEYGQSAANARYDKAKVTYQDYINSLKSEAAKIELVPETQRTGVQLDYLKTLNKRIEDEENSHKDKLRDQSEKLLAENQSYFQKRKSAEERYNRDSAQLRADNKRAEADERDRKYEEEISAIDLEKIEKLSQYKELFDGIENISKQQAQKDIAYLKSFIENSNLTAETKVAVLGKLKKAQQELDEVLPKGLRDLANGIGLVSSEVSAFNEGLGQALNTLGKMLNSVANIKQGFLDFQKASASKNSTEKIFGQITSSLGILGSAIGVFTGIYNLFFDNSKKQKELEEAQNYRNEKQLNATEALTKALNRQLGLIKDIFGPDRIKAYNEQIKKTNELLDDANKKLSGRFALTPTGNKAADEMISAFNNLPDAQKSTRSINQLIQSLQGLGVATTNLNLLNKSVEELQMLVDGKQLDNITLGYVQNIIDLNSQLKETQKILTEEITGISFDSLTDKIKSVFEEDGIASVKKFASVIQESINSAVGNGFKRNVVEKALQPYFDELYKAGLDGTFTEKEIADLKKIGDTQSAIIAEGAKQWEKLLTPIEDGSNFSALQKSIQGITENTASALEGILRGSYDQQKQMVINLKDGNSIVRQQLDVATAGVRQLEMIQVNTANGVVELKNTVSELVKSNATLIKIEKNTGGQTSRGLGI